MIIESSTYRLPKVFTPNYKLIGLAFFGVTFTSGLVLTAVRLNQQPTGTFLSPLPSGQLADTSSNPTPTTPIASFAETLNLAQNFLDKAYSLSAVTNQTETDKQTIIDSLNQSLTYANQAISQSPRQPRGYLVRAKIFTAISQINPTATNQAKTDLEVAQALSNGQTIQLPESINPLNLLPNQQAATAQNIIIAAPADATSAANQTNSNSNSLTSTITLPAGKTELVVKNKQVKANSYIYIIPQTSTNNPIYVKSKDTGVFTLSTNTANTIDIALDYWIVSP